MPVPFADTAGGARDRLVEPLDALDYGIGGAGGAADRSGHTGILLPPARFRHGGRPGVRYGVRSGVRYGVRPGARPGIPSARRTRTEKVVNHSVPKPFLDCIELIQLEHKRVDL
ncbi:hypothetical protein SSBG_04302 [Streptomyces sp. SPB074]|nr:hypothetical protein SSBG_04302 [Streptomyces sp. SPB074]